MVTICFMALSLDIILVGKILKYRYTACIPSCLDKEDVFMIACICMYMYRQVLLGQIEPTCNAWAWAMHFMGVTISFYGCGFLFVRYWEAILY